MSTATQEKVNGTNGTAVGPPSIVRVISQVMAEVQAVGKSDMNREQGYTFRGIDAVVNAVGPVFRKYGVVAVPFLENAGYRDVQTSRGKPSRECTVRVRYRFYGPAGDYLEAVVPGESMDFGDKGTAKAMSVAYRIALLQLLTIPTHEPEPDAQVYERDNAPAAPRPPTREEVIAKGKAAIAAVEDPAALPALEARVGDLLAAGTITDDDAKSLRALIADREVELRDQQPAGAGV